jgi:preprotein translocase SecE subunit
MAKAKKEVKEATISETKEKKKEEKIVEEEKVLKEEKIEKVETKKNKKKKDGFFKGIRKEMKQVVWPSAGNVLKSTIAVLVICVFLALFFLAVTLFMAWLKVFLKGLFV